MRVDLEIDDDRLNQLLVAFGAEPEDFVGNRRLEAVRLLLAHGIETLEDAADTSPSLRSRIEASLLTLASADRIVSDDVDRRGVPVDVWVPGVGWRPAGSAPSGWQEIETAVTALWDALSASPGLRLVATARLLPTNEETTEVVAAAPLDPVEVIVRIGGRRYRLRFDPEQVVVIGRPTDDPELIADR
jgi:hypothetical protein